MVEDISSLLLLTWAPVVTLFLPLVLSAPRGGAGFLLFLAPGVHHPLWILLPLSQQVCK